ncbi:hypothetical protein KKB3_00356 [Dehalococcoides mccartyi]|nr:hypothetical protein KKB3_00356 [Dehalococcoides mccartyi]
MKLIYQKSLSKSKYITGLQCLKLLWKSANDSVNMPEVSPATQHTFDQGHQVGELVKLLYPEGISLQTENFSQNLKDTREALLVRLPLFEAGFLTNRLYSRVDILNPAGADEWDIIEVKSTTEVKEEHFYDIAFQRLCCQFSGLKVRDCYLMHLNKDYIKSGEIDSAGLFVTENLTDKLAEYTCDLEANISAMLDTMDSETCPEATIGKHCDSPYPCPLKDDCWLDLPEHNIFTLYYGNKICPELQQMGILEISQIPAGIKLNAKQQIQKDCVTSATPYVKSAEITSFLNKLEYPLHYLDFETFATAVPIYDGTRPYQNIPFQFSLHIQDSIDSGVKHYSYLAENKGDPRPGFLAELKKDIGLKGSILVYYESFEKTRLKELSVAFPEYSEWINSILERIKDLIVPFKDFSYYHPKQKGSTSLKYVMPALAQISYDNLEIAEGQTASLKFMESVFGNLTREEIQKIRIDLEVYCGQDTGGMVEIVKKLREFLS